MRSPALRLIAATAFIVLSASTANAARAASTAADTPLPRLLSQTGLYLPGSTDVSPGIVAFSPQYPLWSDGTRKRRWIQLPAGNTIDATRVDAWEFPVGTKLWKEFGYSRRIETRTIERMADGSWRYATYVWRADGSDAVLAPDDGVAVEVADAPGGRYAVPSRSDCVACHEGAPVPVLGFTALQLSADRDPLAPHADRAAAQRVDLRKLAARGWLRNLPAAVLASPPRIDAPNPTARAALGYLHGNCGHCHNAAGALTGLELLLAQQADPAAHSAERTLQSLLGHSSRFRAPGSDAVQRVAAHGGSSVLTLRMKTDNPLARMPPLGVHVVDTEGVALIERWIAADLQASISTR
jgi:mono/diheme cytochrome c family protein